MHRLVPQFILHRTMAGEQNGRFPATAMLVDISGFTTIAVVEAKAYHRWGWAHWQEGQYREARPYLEKTLKLTRAHTSLTEEAQCLYDLSVINHYQTQYQGAQANLQAALSAYRAINDTRGEISCLSLAGIIYDKTGNFSAAQVQKIMAWMEANGTGGIELPVRVYLFWKTCRIIGS